jgi:hypothetical protein
MDHTDKAGGENEKECREAKPERKSPPLESLKRTI